MIFAFNFYLVHFFPGGKYFLGRRDRKVDTQSSLISLLCGSISSRLGYDGIRPTRWWCHNLRCNISTHSFQFSLAISLSLSLLSIAIHYEEGVNVEEPHNNPKLFRYASHPMPKVLFFSIYATVDGTSFPFLRKRPKEWEKSTTSPHYHQHWHQYNVPVVPALQW